MAKVSFVFLLFIFSSCCYAQNDTSSVRQKSLDRALELRYGNNKSSWPIWLRNPIALSNGMILDNLYLNDLTCNGGKIKFEESLDFESAEPAFSIKRVTQNGFYFGYVNGEWVFDSSVMKKDVTVPIQCMIKSNGIELNELSTIKKKFPNSYDWRDGYPNMLLGVIPEDYWNDIVLIIFSLPDSGNTLQLFYYQEKLFFIYKGISLSDR